MPILKKSPYFSAVDEMFQGRQGTPWSLDGHREYTRNFLVITKIKELNAIAVQNAPGIPRPGSIYISGNGLEYDLLAIAQSYRCRQKDEGDWQNWIVEVQYSTRTPVGGFNVGNDGSQNNPEREPAEISWGAESLQQAPFHDLKGTPYLSSNRRPYSPPPTFDMAYPVLTISRNELSYDLDKADYYTNALNDRPFLGWPRGRAQVLRPVSKQAHRGLLTYWRVSYTVRFRRKYPTGDATKAPFKTFDGVDDTWQPRILNVGLDALVHPVTDPPKHLDIYNADGKRVSTPQLLDELGRLQNSKDANNLPIPTYKTYEQFPYANLNLLLTVGVGIPINI